MTVHIDLEPIGRRGECGDDRSLLDCARQLGVDVDHGGQMRAHPRVRGEGKQREFVLVSVTFVQMQAEVPKTAQKPNFYN